MSHIQDDESSHEHKSRVAAFHSKHQWNTHFAASKDSNKLMVIDFTATSCGPCRAMEPIFRDYADKFTDVEFVKLDVDALLNPRSREGCGNGVWGGGNASFVFVKKGQVVDKIVGARKDELQKMIEKHRRS